MSVLQEQKNISAISGQFLVDKHSEIELPQGVDVDPLQLAKSYFEAKRTQLENDPNLKNKFVAILNGAIIGSGDDGATLAIEMYKIHGYVPILIRKIGEELKYNTSPRA